MASSNPKPRSRHLSLFLNTSFVFLIFFYLNILFINTNSSPKSKSTTVISTHSRILQETISPDCDGLHDYDDYEAKCLYVKTHDGCISKGYIKYLQIFYCSCGQNPVVGYVALLLWLSVLFYLLGNTAADYFCSSLESLSRVLNLHPTIAGVTLLALGNGAPDVFASIVSFTRSSNGDFGLNSILGGAFFVSVAVVGIISVFIGPHQIAVDKHSFIRDVLFLLFSLSAVLVILSIGRINLWGAICFSSIYLVYVLVVSSLHFFYKNKETSSIPEIISPPSKSSCDAVDVGIPLLGCVDEENPNSQEKISARNQEEYSPRIISDLDSSAGLISRRLALKILELPLYLPRRMTIPVVTEEKWSKPYAVISVTLAPILLAALCNTQREDPSVKTILVTYFIGGLVGMTLGNIAYMTTKHSSPPQTCLFPWLAGGFIMSVTWTYITAQELVSLLVSIGHIIGISPSVLGLTVLAWGNSLGDLIANAAMAMNGGPSGAQIAISGCYAGPMFNILIGLGMSFVFSSASEYPSAYVIPEDHSLYTTLLFLIGGLLWALVILPKKKMKVDRVLGGGLLAIYFCFLFLRLANALGLLDVKMNVSNFFIK